jgi:anti-anti-sigma regulatory factor
MPVDCVVADHDGGLLAVLSGRLELADVGALRLRLQKCLAEQPSALLVDLAELSVSDPMVLSVFLALARQAARWPGIPVLLCAPTAPVGTALADAAFRRLPVFAGVAEAGAQAGVYRRSLPSLTDDLLPITGAARQARNMATEACLRWELPQLVAPASLIASELISNVVEHANTMATLRLSLRPRFLTIGVQDGSSAAPIMSDAGRTGRGLLLVKESAHSWGWMPTDGGKVVWASLAR